MVSALGQRAVGLAYGLGWWLVRGLPTGLARRLFQIGADWACARSGPGVRQLRRNLARVVPRATDGALDELVRQSLRSYARYWCEAFRLPAMNHQSVYRDLDPHVDGREHLDAALARGKGVIVALPHSGNFDMAGVWLVHYSGRFTTVAERLRPEFLYRKFVSYRESLGFEILPLTGGPRSPSAVAVERLRDNRVVCLVGDRDLTGSGVPVVFFGESTLMPAGPARLAAATGAVLLPVGSWFTERGWAVRIHPPITVAGRDDAADATQRLADVFAADIAAHPADWHMMQPLWPADVSGGAMGVQVADRRPPDQAARRAS